MTQIQTAAIYDAEYETTYIACIQRNGDGWHGWIQEHPKVKCEGETKAALLETLEKNALRNTRSRLGGVGQRD